MALADEVAEAIEEIRASFADSKVTLTEDGQGGAFVVVDPVDLGPAYKEQVSWIGFQITFQYPLSDVYPHFVREDLERIDGAQLGEGFSKQADWQGRKAVQVSRRSNHLNPATDTAAIKLHKVLRWIRAH
jgi:hypothetical protein